MRSKPFLIAAFVTGLTVASFPARADRDSAGAGIVIGGAIGAVVGGPPGWVLGMALGAAIGEGEAQRNARIYGTPTYADAPYPRPGYATPPHAVYLPHHASVPATRIALPPPGFNGVPPDYAPPRAAYYPPRVVYPAPVYYGPRRYYY